MIEPLAKQAIAQLRERSLSVAVAESLTGGLLLAELTAVPGASLTVVGGVVAYSSSVKEQVLGVDNGVLAAHGPVAGLVAEQMATGVAELCGADVGISTTGVAGPGAHDGVAAGTFWVAAASRGEAFAQEHHVSGDRQTVRVSAVRSGLKLLLEITERA